MTNEGWKNKYLGYNFGRLQNRFYTQLRHLTRKHEKVNEKTQLQFLVYHVW